MLIKNKSTAEASAEKSLFTSARDISSINKQKIKSMLKFKSLILFITLFCQGHIIIPSFSKNHILIRLNNCLYPLQLTLEEGLFFAFSNKTILK